MIDSSKQEMSYYENSSDDLKSTEKAIVAEDIEFDSLQPLVGKFFIPAITPSMDTEEIEETTNAKFSQSNYVELTIPPYFLLMFMNPVLVPISAIRHSPSTCGDMCTSQAHRSSYNYYLGFKTNKFKIPKGTEFLIEFLGGYVELDKIAIIGIYSLTTVTDEDSVENNSDKYYYHEDDSEED